VSISGLIKQIEKLLAIKLQPAPVRGTDLIGGLMAFKLENGRPVPKFAADGEDLIGLNLAALALTDKKWEELLALLGDRQEKIRALNLSDNSLTSFFLSEKMPSLERLNISGNSKLEKLVIPEGVCASLERIDAYDAALTELFIPAGLAKLKALDFRNNKLSKVEFQGGCPELEILNLRDNQLTAFSLEGSFPMLRYVNLDNNEVEQLAIQDHIPSLLSLYLKNNRLRHVPENLFSLFPNLDALYLAGNTEIKNILKEFLPTSSEENSAKRIKDFLTESGKGTHPNYRFKIILVGNGRVGKTSIYRVLRREKYDPKEPYTHGVQIGILDKRESIPGIKTEKLLASVWDFGGQEIFYATHQFFLTDDALFLLAWTPERNVLEYRERDKETLPFDEKWQSCEYWLESIRLHGKESPILMVQTHLDKGRERVKDHYMDPPYFAECLEFSPLEKYSYTWEELKDRMAEKINTSLSFFGREFPDTYEALIKEVERKRLEKPFIPYAGFPELCEIAGISSGGEDSALDYLYKIGAVVHFGNSEKLKDVIYIDPDWLTQMAYKLINNELRKRRGRFDMAYLRGVFPEFSEEECEQFVELLKRFELVFEISQEDTEDEEKKAWVAPLYLPGELEGDAKVMFKMFIKDLELGFAFRFPKFIPDNVMVNFLSRYGPYSEKLFWRTGICFSKDEKTSFFVRLDPEEQVLFVYNTPSESGPLLHREICQAFIELSKNANAEISNDGKVFGSWQELDKNFELFKSNPKQQFFAIDGKTPLLVKDFARFFERAEVMGVEYGEEREVEMIKQRIDILLEKKNQFEKALAIAYDEEKKFGLRRQIDELDEKIADLRQRLSHLEQ
jgi:GTPase SAR1 family protein